MFYLVYPLAAKGLRSTVWMVVILIEIAAYGPLYRLRGPATLYDYFGCFDGIALGALSAFAANRFGAAVTRSAAWAAMVAGAVLAIGTYAKMNAHDHHALGPTLVAAGAALVLFASQCAPFVAARPWRFDPLAYIGRLSYEMYLFHMTIFVLLSAVLLPRFAAHPTPVFAIAMLAVIAISHAIHRFYADPLNRWLRARLLPAAVPRAAGAEPDRWPPAMYGVVGRKIVRLGLSLVLFALLAFEACKLPQVLRVLLPLAANTPWHLEDAIWPPDMAVRNPQGFDRDGDLVWYWIGPDAAIELTSMRPPGGGDSRYSLVFDATAGPSSSDPKRELVLRDAEGSEQKFDFVNKAVARFEVNLHPGKNVYTLKVAYPATRTITPPDTRDLALMAKHFALLGVPTGKVVFSGAATPRAD